MQSTQKMSARSSQDLLRRTCTRSCKDMWQDFIRMFTTSSHKDLYKTSVKIFIYHWGLQDETLARSSDLSLRKDQERDTRFASLRSRKAHGDATRAISRVRAEFVRACEVETLMVMSQERFYARIYKLQEKCRGPRARPTVCASLRNRNAHGQVTRVI